MTPSATAYVSLGLLAVSPLLAFVGNDAPADSPTMVVTDSPVTVIGQSGPSTETPDSQPEPVAELPLPPAYEPPTDYGTPVSPISVTPVIQEDDPAWDCRTMGNRSCGVSIVTANGQTFWYVITFDTNGNPVSVVNR